MLSRNLKPAKKSACLSIHILLLISISSASFACSWGPRRACEWLSADSIFIGQVIETTPTEHPDGRDKWPGYSMRIRVVETLKGSLGTEVQVETGSGGGDCGTPLPPGKRFLIFASRDKQGTLWTGLESWSELPNEDGPNYELTKAAVVEPIKEALTFGRGSLYGRAIFSEPGRWDSQGKRTGAVSERPIPSMVIHATSGTRSFTARTAKDGSFEFSDLPNGRYTVSPEFDPGWAYDQHFFEYRYEKTIGDGSCAKVDFRMSPATRLKVRVNVPQGKQFQVVPELQVPVIQQVVAIPVGLQQIDERNVLQPTADSIVDFEFWPMPPGDYYIGFDVTGPPTKYLPYIPTYYPGVTDRKAARVVHIEEGETKSIEFPMPHVAAKRDAHFVATDASGKPMREIGISILDPKRPITGTVLDGVNAKLPPDGSGSLDIYAGFSYTVFATHFDEITKIGSCTQPLQIPPGSEPLHLRFVLGQAGSDCNLANLKPTLVSGQ
jgi:hypothetical protein